MNLNLNPPVDTLEVHHHGLDTIVLVEANGIVAEGVARCRPDDHYVEAIGEGIAAGRAIAHYGQQLAERWADRSISKAELDERRAEKRRRVEAVERAAEKYDARVYDAVVVVELEIDR